MNKNRYPRNPAASAARGGGSDGGGGDASPTNRKVFFWLFGGVSVLTLLFLALLVLAPRIINTDGVKRGIESFISQKIGGKLEFQEVGLSFFPRPVARVDRVRISIPGMLNGTIGTLRIYPELTALLKSDVHVSKFQIEAPDLTLSLPEKSASLTLRAFQDKVASLLSVLKSRIPGLRAEIVKGSLKLSEAGRPVFSFQNIEGRFGLPGGSLQIGLSCSSNLWERLSLKGKLNPEPFNGEGSVRIDGFLPHLLLGYLFSATSSLVKNSKANLNARFNVDRPGTLQAEVEASAPYPTLRLRKAEQVLKGGNVQATLTLDEAKAMISFTRLSLDAPKLDLTGKFEMDQKTSAITLELEARDLDVGPLRETALSIAGDVPIVQQICDIVRGGTVPRVLFQTGGRSMGDLGAAKSIFMKASLRNGQIYLSGPALNMEQVNGEAVISKGILKGDNIEAHLGNSRGLKGSMTLGLEGDDPAFNLDVLVESDLAELAPMLKGLIRNKSFQEEISRIDNLKGNATGRLILGSSLSSINARAEVSALRLSAGYNRLPRNIEITQGQIVYDGFNDIVSLRDISGKLGESSFSGIAGRFSYGKNPSVDVLSGMLVVLLDEIYPWLTSFPEVDSHLTDIRSVKGVLDLSGVRLEGPLYNPDKWRFDATGKIRDVSVDTSLFEDPVRVVHGKFNVTPQALSLTDVQGQVLDASLTISGALTQFLAGPLKTDITVSGKAGTEATEWISKAARLPAELTLRPPLSISQAHLTLEGERAKNISLQGEFGFENGPDVLMDLLVTPHEVTIRDLLIQDTVSRAAFALAIGKDVVGLKFSGELDSKTLDRMLVGTESPVQWVKGSFQTRIYPDQPWLSTADGHIEGRGIHLPLKQIGPVEVEHVSLRAEENIVKVNSAAFRWLKQPFSLNGVASVSPKGIEFDMNLSGKIIEFETIKQALRRNEKKEVKATSLWANPPLKGILRLKTDRFTLGGFAWEPLHADVSFANEGVNVEIIRGSVCGVSTPGHLKLSDQGIEMEVRPTVLNRELEPTILCLSGKKTDATGTFSLNGQVRSKGKSEDALSSLQGDIRFTARKGQILSHPLLAKIFTFLNVTEILRGRLPDFSQGGFLYDSIAIEGDIRGGKFVFRECIIDGRTVDVIASGEVDMTDETINMAILVTPFKTVNAIVKNIPVVGYILGGTLTSMPVKVTGNLRDPKVDFLSPSEIGSELLAPMKRIIKIPFKIIDPFLPGQTRN